jgi:hypothetical protein
MDFRSCLDEADDEIVEMEGKLRERDGGRQFLSRTLWRFVSGGSKLLWWLLYVGGQQLQVAR